MAKKAATKKAAKAEPKAKDRKPVHGGSSFIVRHLDKKHEATIADLRSKRFIFANTSSGAISDILDKIPAKLVELANVTKERDELDEAMRSYVYALQDETRAADHTTKMLDRLMKLAKRKGVGMPRQLRLDSEY